MNRGLAACVAIVAALGTVGFGAVSSGEAKKPKPTRDNGSRDARLGPAAATAAFGLDLMRAKGNGNLVLSPDSVAAALAMTGTGAAGRTAEEMAQVLHLKGPANFPEVGDLQRAILAAQAAAAASDPEPPILDIANGLFLQEGMPFEPAFLAGAQQRFGATPEAIDFAGNPAGALERINGWVSERTRGRIPRILSSMPQGLRLALANAVYFDQDWAERFSEGATAPGTFHGTGGKSTAQLMHQTASFRYGAGPGYKAVALPYRSSNFSLLVMLPVKQRLRSLERHLDGRRLARIARRLSPRPVGLTLPRFHLSMAADLSPALLRLGMPTAFDLRDADFSHITTVERLYIAFVQHAADFVVDEGGTVATAATVVGVATPSARVVPRDPVRFKADRPFLFFLRDDRTGAILFAGRLTQA